MLTINLRPNLVLGINKKAIYIQIGNWVVKFNTCTEGGILPWGQWIYDHYNGSIALVWLGRDDTLQLPGHLPVLWHAHFFGTFLVYRYYWTGGRESLLKMTLYNSHDTPPLYYIMTRGCAHFSGIYHRSRIWLYLTLLYWLPGFMAPPRYLESIILFDKHSWKSGHWHWNCYH